MWLNFKKKPAYYSVHALRDGTIWLALQGRKPSRKDKAKIDEEGIFQWLQSEERPDGLSDWGKSVFHTNVAMTLNMKRIVRLQVESKLDIILKRLDDLHERLDQLEAKLVK